LHLEGSAEYTFPKHKVVLALKGRDNDLVVSYLNSLALADQKKLSRKASIKASRVSSIRLWIAPRIRRITMLMISWRTILTISEGMDWCSMESLN